MGSVDVLFPAEPYKCTLPADTVEVAQKELREDDEIREQALEKMREWIRQNPAIKKCRMDSKFLLRFLRTKKFSIPQACAQLEKYLVTRQMYPNFFQNLDIEDPKLQELFDAGYLVIPPKRDSKNRRIILSSLSRVDPSKFTNCEISRLHAIMAEYLFDDEMNQIHGYVTLQDFQAVSPAHMSIWSLSELKFFANCIQNVSPMRYKQIHLLNMPSIMKQVIDFIMSIVNDKLKSRLQTHKTMEEFGAHFDLSLLPKELGGDVPMSEMLADLKKELKARRETLLALDDMFVDLSLCTNVEEITKGEADVGASGSFRKLNID